jgi:hypothetical protein
MNLVTFRQAANILGVSVDAIYQAVEPGREVLTKAGRQGTNGLLLEEQVRLFQGINPKTGRKKRLSLNALSEKELALWKTYASQASQPVNTEKEINIEDTMRQIAHEEMVKVRSQDLINLLESISSIIKGDIKESVFFSEHKVLETIAIAVLTLASIVSAVILYQNLSKEEQEVVIAYLNTVDVKLEQDEKKINPPIPIEEIREKRQRIAEFRGRIAS